jgi:glutathione S-transferase
MQRGFRRGYCFFSRGGQAGGFRPRRAAGAVFAGPEAAAMRAEAAELRRRLAAIEERLAGKGAGDPESAES